MTTDKRKQSLYFPESMLKDVQHEAARLDRSLSWIVQRCVKLGIGEVRRIPSVNEVESEEGPTEVEGLEGIGPGFAEKLVAAGVSSIHDLRTHGAQPAGRKKLAASTGIGEKLILRWVNMADLLRIDGIDAETGDLLETCGVDSVVELATREPAALVERLVEVNTSKQLVRTVPSRKDVTAWIAQAKGLERGVFH